MVAVLVAATLSPQVGLQAGPRCSQMLSTERSFLHLTPWEEVRGAGDGERQDSKLISQICNRQVLPCISWSEMKADV